MKIDVKYFLNDLQLFYLAFFIDHSSINRFLEQPSLFCDSFVFALVFRVLVSVEYLFAVLNFYLLEVYFIVLDLIVGWIFLRSRLYNIVVKFQESLSRWFLLFIIFTVFGWKMGIRRYFQKPYIHDKGMLKFKGKFLLRKFFENKQMKWLERKMGRSGLRRELGNSKGKTRRKIWKTLEATESISKFKRTILDNMITECCWSILYHYCGHYLA